MAYSGELGLNCLSDDEQLFLEQVRRVMESYFASDIRRIVHAHDVTRHAVNLLQYIDADPLLTIAASYLHDIGIPEAERKFGRCDGKLQEQEGPPVARMLLEDIGAEVPFIDRVCQLVGHHHSPGAIDAPEFRILWDADALVNLAAVVGDKDRSVVAAILAKALVTEPGFRMAQDLYLAGENKSD